MPLPMPMISSKHPSPMRSTAIASGAPNAIASISRPTDSRRIRPVSQPASSTPSNAPSSDAPPSQKCSISRGLLSVLT